MGKGDIFNLSEDELGLVKAKKSKKNQLGFAVFLKYFQLENHYPKHIKFIDPVMLSTLSNQLNIPASQINQFDWEGRSTERFRQEIRKFIGHREAINADIQNLKSWLFNNVFSTAVRRSKRIEHAYTYFRDNKIEPFTSNKLDRHIRSAHHEFEQSLFKSIYSSLSKKTKIQMDDLLSEDLDMTDEDDGFNPSIKFRHIKTDIAGVKLKNVSESIQKINCLKQLDLPNHMFFNYSIKLIKKHYRRVMAERPISIREYKPHIRYALFSIFCYFRSQLITDDLTDLFMKLINQLKTKSESFVEKKILSEVKCVNGKFDILYKLSLGAAEHPAGIIQEVIYPEVGQETLKNLAKELYFRGKWYQTQVQIKMNSLYSHASRKVLLTLLNSFEFKTNVNESKDLIEAIQLIKANHSLNREYYPDDIKIPIKNVIPNDWMNLVLVDLENGTKKINQLNYELSVF